MNIYFEFVTDYVNPFFLPQIIIYERIIDNIRLYKYIHKFYKLYKL